MIHSALEDLIPKLEGLRTRIVYDVQVAKDVLFFSHILPYFSSRRIFWIVYSETACRKLKNKYERFSKLHPEIAKILDYVYLVKIGYNDRVRFGKLYSFIREDKNFKWLNEFSNIFEEIRDKDLVTFSGFSIFVAINGRKALKNLICLADLLPENVTAIVSYQDGFYDDRLNTLVDKLYDVIIRVKKEEEFTGFGETTFLVGVEQSTVEDIQPGFARFKIDNGKFVEL